MEVSGKEAFRLSEESHEWKADYFTWIIYQSNDRVVNKNLGVLFTFAQ
jgi:hypothetical protein